MRPRTGNLSGIAFVIDMVQVDDIVNNMASALTPAAPPSARSHRSPRPWKPPVLRVELLPMGGNPTPGDIGRKQQEERARNFNDSFSDPKPLAFPLKSFRAAGKNHRRPFPHPLLSFKAPQGAWSMSAMISSMSQCRPT